MVNTFFMVVVQMVQKAVSKIKLFVAMLQIILFLVLNSDSSQRASNATKVFHTDGSAVFRLPKVNNLVLRPTISLTEPGLKLLGFG